MDVNPLGPFWSFFPGPHLHSPPNANVSHVYSPIKSPSQPADSPYPTAFLASPFAFPAGIWNSPGWKQRTPGSPLPTDDLLVSLTRSVSPSLNMGGAHIDSHSLTYHVQASQQIPQPSLLSSAVTNLVQVTTASCRDYFNTLNWPPSSISSPPSNHSDIKTHQKHKMAHVTSHRKHFNSIYS